VTLRHTFLLVAAGVAFAPTALADTTEESCIEAAVDGQKLRKAGALIKARKAFGLCSRIDCPKEIGERCTGWLAEVEPLVPSIVVSVQDAAGRDVLDAEVTIDGEPRDVRSGTAVDVEPGVHAIEAKTLTGGAKESVVVREGERARLIRLVFTAAAPPPPTRVEPPKPDMTFRWIAISSFATGAVATGFFIGFAAVGVADRERFGCARSCGPSQYSQVSNELLAADVMLVVAGVTVAAGVVFWLLSRPPSATPSSTPTALVRW
jgi:hypothetical protein